MYKKSLFIFRRDLRLSDNTGLREAIRQSEKVAPIFIFDPRQIGDSNPFRGQMLLQFMVRSLRELRSEIEGKGGILHFFAGEGPAVVGQLLDAADIEAVFFNGDYTPFSRKRDKEIAEVCKSKNRKCHAFHDALLFEPGRVMKGDGSPYTVYTPFSKRAKQMEIPRPQLLPRNPQFFSLPKQLEQQHPLTELENEGTKSLHRKGGRREALAILKRVSSFKQYYDRRNTPSDTEGTTGLSPHLKFGTVSAREVYSKFVAEFGVDHGVVGELLWRDFFTCIGFHFPHVFGNSFRSEYDNIEWSNKKDEFSRWCNGQTGFPLVDAGMRQLNASGFMHNRIRMVVASFLMKDLHIDWRWGEKYFATRLLDYDPAVNNGNWQWAASSGCDAQPFFRIFNPWSQQQRFDSDCTYIRAWIPELSKFSPKEIHSLEKGDGKLGDYPKPMLDHREAREVTEEIYSVVKKR
ncbi:MAG: deoxyribodipyrimidine photo-lyase [Bdellovibrionales bacterium]|nr:deoxyribodipyrimidine photo-lyase [Bdellovibrionales bacterium]